MANEIGEISADVRQLLDEHPWEETTPRLLRHVQNKIERLKWRGFRRGEPPGGAEAADIVQNVYKKVLAGTRKWDPVKQPDLFEYLRDQVDSEISNLVTSSENKCVRREGLPSSAVLERIDELSPEQILLVKEREKESDEFVLGFMEFLEGQPELQQIVDAIVDGIEKRAEIARHLHTSVEEIDLCRKRLKRRLEEYMSRPVSPSTSPRGGVSHARP
jgi:hypothetical protein